MSSVSLLSVCLVLLAVCVGVEVWEVEVGGDGEAGVGSVALGRTTGRLWGMVVWWYGDMMVWGTRR